MKTINIYTIKEAEEKLTELTGNESKIEYRIIDNLQYKLEETNTPNNQEYWTVQEVNKKTSEILKEMKSKFKVWCYYSDRELDKDFPIPKKLTTRKFKANVETDEELKNKSANDLEKEGIIGITLRERLLLELQYFNQTGKHLDTINFTLCSGSRRSDGQVPYVDFSSVNDEVYVLWFYSNLADRRLRSRAVVS